MNKMTPRDRWILALLPAIVLVLGYQYMKANPLTISINTLRAQLKEAPQGGSPAEFQKAVAEADEIEKKLEFERERQKSFATRTPGVPADWRQADRARTLQELTRLCEASGVTLLASTLSGGSDGGGGSLPAPLNELAKVLKEKHGMPEAQLWKFEISAPYARVAALLKRFSASDRFILPVQLDMKIENDDPELKWTVLLWI